MAHRLSVGGPFIILLFLLPQKLQYSMPSQVSLEPPKTPTSFSTACRLVCVGGTFLDLVRALVHLRSSSLPLTQKTALQSPFQKWLPSSGHPN